LKKVRKTSSVKKSKTVSSAKTKAVQNTGFKVEYNGLKSKIVKKNFGTKKVPKTMHTTLAQAKKALLSKLRGDYSKSITKIKNLKTARPAAPKIKITPLKDETQTKEN